MKRLLSTALALGLAVLTGCGIFPVVRGSGFLVDSHYSYSDFAGVTAEQAFKVTIVADSVWSVTVTCDDNVVPYLEVTREGGLLRIGLTPFTRFLDATLAAEVRMPVLTFLEVSGAAGVRVGPGFASALDASVTVSGAGSVEVQGLTCGALDLNISGVGSATASSLDATSLTAELSGESSLVAAGRAPWASITASGAGSGHLLDLVAGSADLDLSGASKVWVDVGSGVVTVSASGASVLYYSGSPLFQIEELSGESQIHRVD
jgi:hypothetical protein